MFKVSPLPDNPTLGLNQIAANGLKINFFTGEERGGHFAKVAKKKVGTANNAFEGQALVIDGMSQQVLEGNFLKENLKRF